MNALEALKFCPPLFTGHNSGRNLKSQFSLELWVKLQKKFCIWETLNLLTFADSSTNTKRNPQKDMCQVMYIQRPVFAKLWPRNVAVISDKYVAFILDKYVAVISDNYVAVISNNLWHLNVSALLISCIEYSYSVSSLLILKTLHVKYRNTEKVKGNYRESTGKVQGKCWKSIWKYKDALENSEKVLIK